MKLRQKLIRTDTSVKQEEHEGIRDGIMKDASQQTNRGGSEGNGSHQRRKEVR